MDSISKQTIRGQKYQQKTDAIISKNLAAAAKRDLVHKKTAMGLVNALNSLRYIVNTAGYNAAVETTGLTEKKLRLILQIFREEANHA